MKNLMLVVLGLIAAQSAFARSPIVSENFFLMDHPGVPNRFCARGADMNVDYVGFRVNLVNVVRGACEIFVQPNKRTYDLQPNAKKDNCGSYHWFGTRTTAEGKAQIEIVDHRRRLCEDVRPSALEVIETAPNGATSVRYSAQQR